MTRHCYLLLFLILTVGRVAAQSAPLSPQGLKINYLTEPLGIDDAAPRFSWEVVDNDRNDTQSAYEIIVSSTLEGIKTNAGDVWQSGKVNSNCQNGVEYKGVALLSETKYWWQVRTYDKEGNQGQWSAPTYFETGIFEKSEWKAKFITGTFNLARKEFTLPAGKVISKARAYVSSDGYYELHINGSKIGNHVLDPADTETAKLMLYSCFDITSNLINQGANAIGLMIGAVTLHHRSAFVQAICQIEIWFTDGSKQTIFTDESWAIKTGGPIISQHIYDGENYDANKEIAGWDQAAYNQTGWTTPTTQGYNNFPVGWTVNNGVLEVVNGEAGDILPIPFNYSDYTFEADVKILNLCAGLIFRAKDKDNYYMWQFNPGVVGLRPHKKLAGVFSLLSGNLPITPALALNKTFHVKIVMNGNNIKTYVDGVLVNDMTDNNFLLGTIGIRQGTNAKAQFDNMTVTANGNVVFNDTFETFSSNWDKSTAALKLKAQMDPIMIHEVITPVAMYNPSPGTYVFDMGKNISGWAEITVQGAAGTKIELKYGERKKTDGTANTSSTNNGFSALATDYYTLKGIGIEVWEPRFTYHGFRFVELRNFPGVATINSVKGKFIHSKVTDKVSEFSCSNPDLNAIYKAYQTTQVDNMIGLPTDCNQRAEREGWMADAMLTSESAMLYFDANAFYEKWINDIVINERVGKGSGDVCVPAAGGGDDVIWESAIVSVPWDYYNFTGDSAFLSKIYPRCKRFVDWYKGLDTNNNFLFEPDTEGLTEGGTFHSAWRFNEWNPVGGNGDAFKNTKTYMGTLYYFHCVNLLSKMAQALGNSSDYSFYSNLATNIKNKINSLFLNTSFYDNNKQTGNALAVAYALVPTANSSTVLNNLCVDVFNNGDTKLKTGCLGTYGLMRALGDEGRNDLAYQLAARKTYPSWGYMLNVPDAPGTFWENWENIDFSKNHPYMSGSVATWLFHYVGGIKQSKPGFSEIQFKPDVTNQLDSAYAKVYSVKGPIVSKWKKTKTDFCWNVSIPTNSTGILYIPTLGYNNNIVLTESYTVLWNNIHQNQTIEISYLRTEGDFQVWAVGSGNYNFKVAANSTGLPFEKSLTSVDIFPNPTSGKISISSPRHEVKSIKIFDSTGCMVYSSANAFSGYKSIDLKLDKGIYLVKLTGDVPFVTHKLMLK